MIQEDMEEDPGLTLGKMVRDFDNIFVLGNPPAYEQSPENCISSIARSKGVSPESLAYDLMLQGNFLYLALANYPRGNLDVIGELLAHMDVVPGLGDGGAHATTICDASYSTFLLSYWGRDRENGRLEIDYIINRLTHAQATFLGLKDRGRLEVGLRADINVIDMDNIGLYAPELRYDLPGGGKRLIQRSRGYEATIVKGVPVTIKGIPTGELPGRLYRA
jgi:N-acyl-D-aspartate/D-glutamate deacylase